jgi:hypothetical protein
MEPTEQSAPTGPDPLSVDFALNQRMIVGRVDRNVTQDFIIITADRARLILRDAVDNMERSKAWQTPLGILATIFVALPITSFQDFLGLSKDTWKALFILAALLCVYWLLRSLLRIANSPSVEDIVNRLRTAYPLATTPQQPAQPI